jgi:hypothetical protein
VGLWLKRSRHGVPDRAAGRSTPHRQTPELVARLNHICYDLPRYTISSFSRSSSPHLSVAKPIRELQREQAWSRIYLVPLILAEQDRDAYRRNQAALAREKEIMKDVPGWEVGPSISCRAAVLLDVWWYRS